MKTSLSGSYQGSIVGPGGVASWHLSRALPVLRLCAVQQQSSEGMSTILDCSSRWRWLTHTHTWLALLVLVSIVCPADGDGNAYLTGEYHAPDAHTRKTTLFRDILRHTISGDPIHGETRNAVCLSHGQNMAQI